MRLTALVASCILSLVFRSAISLGQDAPAPAAQPAEKPAAAKKPVYDEKADAKQQIDSALARAKRNNQRVLIQWGANWCTWCIALDQLGKANSEVSRELLYEYQVIKIDIGKWDKNIDLAKSFGADFKSSGVPYLTILDAHGNVLANQETASVELAAKEGEKPQIAHDPAKVIALLKKYRAAPLHADDVYAKGLADAESSGRTAFVHFGAPWCPWCHVLEDWMNRPEIAAILAKDFVDVRIDVDRMPGGKEILSRLGAGANVGIPWFAIVNSDGHVLINSEGPEGNVGCPAAPAEIEHFRTMLTTAQKNITSEEIELLLKSVAQAAGSPTGH